jgi:hypothetical protein
MKLPPLPTTFGILTLLLIISAGLVLYAQGFRLDLSKRVVEKTGMILARSIPEGARVYLDGKLITATNSPISNLKPGTYHLKMEKEGFFSWEREIPVKEGLVTDITALLPSLSPSLTAVTQNGARLITPAPSGNKTLFLSEGNLYLLNLTNPPLGFLRTSPQKIAEESKEFPLSNATGLVWSPNEDQALVAIDGYSYLLSTAGRNGSPTLVQDAPNLLKSWSDLITAQKTELVKGLDLPAGEAGLSEELAAEATKPSTLWSPDERKFLYAKALPAGRQEFWVVNLSDPLPVGDQEHRMILETQSDKLRLFWLANSHHFVMIEEGLVSLLDLDGSNKRDLFRGTLAETAALSTTDLSKIIILTSFTPQALPNLYAISLR